MRRKLNKEKLQSCKRPTMSMKDSLRDVEPVPWHEDVLSGAKKNSNKYKIIHDSNKGY